MRHPIFSTFRVAVPDKATSVRALRVPKKALTVTRDHRCRATNSHGSCLSPWNRAEMLSRLLLFHGASLLLLAGPEVSHPAQGAKSAIACVLYEQSSWKPETMSALRVLWVCCDPLVAWRCSENGQEPTRVTGAPNIKVGTII